MNVGGGVPVDMPSGIGVGAAPADCAETASARAPLSPAILARGLALPAVSGAACVLAFAPFYAWPVALAGLALLFGVWERSGSALQAALSGFAFGLGYFLSGVSWVFVSLHYFGAMPAVLAAIATFLFCAYLAIFPALTGWIAVRFGAGSGAARLALAAAAFAACEWVRGWLFTGFPWLTIGTSQVPASPLAGFAPLLGAYGTSAALAACAALLVALVRSFAWSRARFAILGALAALFFGGGLARQADWTEAAGAHPSSASAAFFPLSAAPTCRHAGGRATPTAVSTLAAQPPQRIAASSLSASIAGRSV